MVPLFLFNILHSHILYSRMVGYLENLASGGALLLNGSTDLLDDVHLLLRDAVYDYGYSPMWLLCEHTSKLVTTHIKSNACQHPKHLFVKDR